LTIVLSITAALFNGRLPVLFNSVVTRQVHNYWYKFVCKVFMCCSGLHVFR